MVVLLLGLVHEKKVPSVWLSLIVYQYGTRNAAGESVRYYIRAVSLVAGRMLCAKGGKGRSVGSWAECHIMWHLRELIRIDHYRCTPPYQAVHTSQKKPVGCVSESFTAPSISAMGVGNTSLHMQCPCATDSTFGPTF